MKGSFSQLGRSGVLWLRNWIGSRDYQAPSLTALPRNFESFFPFVVSPGVAPGIHLSFR